MKGKRTESFLDRTSTESVANKTFENCFNGNIVLILLPSRILQTIIQVLM